MNWIAAGTILCVTALLGQAGDDPFDAREDSAKEITKSGLASARATIARLLGQRRSAYDEVHLAELMKLVGDVRASEHYAEAIRKEPNDPAIDYLFGEYLRNFRGPMAPLFGDAERHFFDAARKLGCLGDEGKSGRSKTLRDQLIRSIVALYERDGLPLSSWASAEPGCQARVPGASLYLSVGARGGEQVTDLDVSSDIRDLTSAAAYSQSLRVAFGPLSADLLERFLRTVTPFENRSRLRARYKGARLDLFFNDRHAGNAAITYPSLRDPAFLSNRDLVTYNALRLNEFGASAERPFRLSGATDADLAFTYSKIRRSGLVDDLPDAVENINQFQIASVISHQVGPDKVNGEFSFVDQSITPEQTPYQSRGRQIYAGTFRYQMFRLGSGGYRRVFQDTRGVELFAGATHDHENFGYLMPALVSREDYFVGATLHGLWKLDLSVQPTWFVSTVSQDPSRNNRQYRTTAYGLVRLVDEERKGPNLTREWHGWHLGFVHLAIPIRFDVPQQGIPAFANRKVGAELAAKWFTTARGGTTFLGSARYDVQQFTTLNRTFSLFTLGVTMGF